MAVFPSQITAIRGKSEVQHQWKTNVIRIKIMYLKRRYKQCAALCQELIQTHPLRQTFLHFYKAVCFASLGLQAHVYSVNRVSMLESARSAFAEAQSLLPLPLASDSTDESSIWAESPILEEWCSAYSLNNANEMISPLSTPLPTIPNLLSEAGSHMSLSYSESKDYPGEYTVPDFDKYSPRSFLNTLAEPYHPIQIPTPLSKSDHKVRLSESLSCDHVIEEELIPSPLHSRENAAPINDKADRKNKALPTLTFNHNPRFITKGSQLVCNPTRKPAQHQLLPSVFLDSSPPVTPRFTAIHNAFDQQMTNNGDDEGYAGSPSSRCYGASLLSFRTQISKHISAVESAILKTEDLQREHNLKRSKREWVASCWSFEASTCVSAAGYTNNTSDEGKELGLKHAKIEKLRKDGWVVTKERHGFKGTEYYHALRARAEEDLVSMSADCGPFQ